MPHVIFYLPLTAFFALQAYLINSKIISAGGASVFTLVSYPSFSVIIFLICFSVKHSTASIICFPFSRQTFKGGVESLIGISVSPSPKINGL
jgi:hypothetical protein